MILHSTRKTKITTACILAAGTGSRLLPLTDCKPKCLTEVHGRSILERLVTCLRAEGFRRLVFVVGYLDDCIRESLEQHAADLAIEFVFNPDFATTNNCYSLWLARNRISESFLLIESDLVFDAPMLRELSQPDRIAVSRTLPWMNGTMVVADAENHVVEFIMNRETRPGEESLKTVNICSLSAKSWRAVIERLGDYVAAGRLNEYYESAFRELVSEGRLDFECVLFDESRWYEIDTVDDLRCAQELFAPATSELVSSLPATPTLL
jgi:choline kinase